MKHERNEDKNDFLLFLLPEIFTVIAGSAAVYAMGVFGKQLSAENALRKRRQPIWSSPESYCLVS